MISVISQRMSKYYLRSLLLLLRKINVRFPLNEYYFGYGANLDSHRLVACGLNSEFIGHGMLRNYKLEFNVPCEYTGQGYAGISAIQNSNVYGSVFKVDRLSLALLDIMEWVPFSFYKRENLPIVLQNGAIREAWVYVPCFPTRGLKPSVGYLSWIMTSARKAQFPECYLRMLSETQSIQSVQIDHGFRLSSPGARRFFEKKLRTIYKYHDRLREALSRKLP